MSNNRDSDPRCYRQAFLQFTGFAEETVNFKRFLGALAVGVVWLVGVKVIVVDLLKIPF